jgi:uncharacterized membrane protein YkoI
VGALLTKDEKNLLLMRVRTELVPNLDAIIRRWKEDYYEADEDFEDFFFRLQSQLSTFKKVLSTDPVSVARIEEASHKIKMDVQEHNDTRDWDYDDERSRGRGSTSEDARSIFDDVDA